MANLDNNQIRNKLITKYQNLSPIEKKIVQLFSVIYEPVTRTNFLACVVEAGINDENDRKFINKTLKPYLDDLISSGLILQEPGKSPKCNPLIAEIAIRDAIKNGYFRMFVSIVENQLPASSSSYRYYNSNSDSLLRVLRINIYKGNLDKIYEEYNRYYQYHDGDPSLSWNDVLLQIFNNPFDADFLSQQSPKLYDDVMFAFLSQSKDKLIPADDVFNLLSQNCLNNGIHSLDSPRIMLLEQLLLRGKLDEVEEHLEQISADSEINILLFLGWLSFIRGENEKAIASYNQAYKLYQKATKKKKIYFGTTSGIFFIFALIKEGSSQSFAQALDYISIILKQKEHWFAYMYRGFERIINIQRGDISDKYNLINTNVRFYRDDNYSSLDTLFRSLCVYWADPKKAQTLLPKFLEPLLKDAQNAGYYWIAMEAGELLTRLQPNRKFDIKPEVLALSQKLGIQTLADLIQPKEEWELSLKALMELNISKTESFSSSSDKRLAWFIYFYSDEWTIYPKEQSMTKQGKWSAGRSIALKRLMNNDGDFSYLTPQDWKVCSMIEVTRSYDYYGSTDYYFKNEAIAQLIDHPLVFVDETPPHKIEVVKGEPQLSVTKNPSGSITLEFVPKVAADQSIVVTRETPTRVQVVPIKPEHDRIIEILGKKNKLTIPAKAEAKVLEAIGNIAQLVTIHSDIGGTSENTPEVPSHSLPHIHLLPVGLGLRVTVLCRPFGEDGPYYRPGNGGAVVIAEIKEQRLQTRRDLTLEKKLAKEVVSQCPTLIMYSAEDGEYIIENPEDCLELLLELQALGDKIIVQWPQGEKLKVTHKANFSNLRLQIKGQQDWFSASGELKLDDDLVFELQQLLELLDKSPGRFVPIGEGQFLALTQEFRQRLDEFKAFSEKHGNGRRFHSLASLAIEDFIDEVGQVKADTHWKNHLQRLKEMETFEPQVPSTLQAELRDYQIDGFNWLARLSHWGVGACLADDMGLGKTLQALAVILTRAKNGASLIIAPTSVCFNWQSEAEKFAPTLNPIMFGSGDRVAARCDRQAVLDQLQPFDLLICTYGLLQQEEVAEMLAKVSWQIIVLDEAQAIKNIATKRSQGAMKLQGEFKLITTGTPIENHLGELWNLFRFINPGLLGSMERFNQRFAQAIERDKDNNARYQLKKLIQPFLLRRTKNQVLTELPSRTEITLQVELSQEEIALYEALRREAIAKLNDSDTEAGQKHLQVLAEIMRLRRACCNPNLVMPDGDYKSAKLEVFGEVLTELLENRHKALVFSQFVDHLHILRNYLEEQKISYQYLDGSTTVKERQKRVTAFQSGEGDVFLISLKAGGTGLNLTAADYVIHMDPWWNPAVEDQASDRAHRIGQKRPVTIYRLVAKNTIEEKIVQLHTQKRDLADSLLEGTDISGKISTAQLLSLIQEK